MFWFRKYSHQEKLSVLSLWREVWKAYEGHFCFCFLFVFSQPLVLCDSKMDDDYSEPERVGQHLDSRHQNQSIANSFSILQNQAMWTITQDSSETFCWILYLSSSSAIPSPTTVQLPTSSFASQGGFKHPRRFCSKKYVLPEGLSK